MKIKVAKLTMLTLAMYFSVLCHAQKSAIVDAPNLAVKLSIPHFFYFYPSVQVGLEHKLFRNVNLQYDVGWIFDGPSNNSENYQNKRGFRGIAEVRYYLPSPPKIPFYIAGEFYYSRVNFDRSQVIGYECQTGNCSYFEYLTYKVENDHQGFGLKYGILLFPGWNRNRSFFFDINGGFAYRTIAYYDIGKPAPANAQFFSNDSSDFFSPREIDHSEFRLIVGIRMGYSFF
jgi:hypothetical protein